MSLIYLSSFERDDMKKNSKNLYFVLCFLVLVGCDKQSKCEKEVSEFNSFKAQFLANHKEDSRLYGILLNAEENKVSNEKLIEAISDCRSNSDKANNLNFDFKYNSGPLEHKKHLLDSIDATCNMLELQLSKKRSSSQLDYGIEMFGQTSKKLFDPFIMDLYCEGEKTRVKMK